VSLRSEHFEGIIDFSEAQQRVISDYITEYGERWIENIMIGSEIPDGRRPTATLRVLQQIFRSKLSLSLNDEGTVYSRNRIFSTGDEGESTVSDIVGFIEEGKTVIIDTSRSADEVELLIGSMVANGLMSRHQNAKTDGALDEVIPVGIVVEEAPRVLGKEKLEKSGNIFSTIAREGRKFKVGLVAVTQLVSVIPQDILTNINTKIILGNELASERNVLIQSAAQDLSEDNRNIASLDKGEAIITSIFTRFAVPIKIPLFEEIARASSRHSERVEYID
jgi:DNA helicase HerA-like ATPase